MAKDTHDDGTDDESDGGFLSTNAEWHAIVHGVYAGMRTLSPTPPDDLPDNADIRAEPHYFKGGFIIGTLMQFAFVIGTAYGLFSGEAPLPAFG